MTKNQLEKEIDKLNERIEELVDKECDIQRKIDDLNSDYDKLRFDRVSDVAELERKKICNKSAKLQDKQYDLVCEISSLEDKIKKLESEYAKM